MSALYTKTLVLCIGYHSIAHYCWGLNDITVTTCDTPIDLVCTHAMLYTYGDNCRCFKVEVVAVVIGYDKSSLIYSFELQNFALISVFGSFL